MSLGRLLEEHHYAPSVAADPHSPVFWRVTLATTAALAAAAACVHHAARALAISPPPHTPPPHTPATGGGRGGTAAWVTAQTHAGYR